MKTISLIRTPFLALLFAVTLITGCKKETEEFQTESLSDYLPAQPGKYIIYRTDSTVFTNFGTATVTRSYQEKHQVDAQLTDNEGRPAYRVFRFLRNANGSGSWRPSGTYTLTPGTASIEVEENNLRFLRLVAPIRQDNTWKGNRHLPLDPYGANYNFSNDDNMAEWDYTYTATGETVTLNGKTLNDVITVQQINESANAPVTQPSAYGYINYGINQYAKGIGLVYEELTMWEYQPNPGGTGYRTGFGVKRSLIDHN
jgi:hypothetical protein